MDALKEELEDLRKQKAVLDEENKLKRERDKLRDELAHPFVRWLKRKMK